jgi:hypothetical protein
MHLPPEIWGPIFWAMMHIVSMAYPDDPTYSEKRAAKDLFNALAQLLPCPVCRTHYKETIQKIPVETWLDNRTSLIEWVWMVHNAVNERLGKPTITQTEFFKRYAEMAERGLPIPPSNPQAEITDAAVEAAWIRGASSAVGVVLAVSIVGGLLWISYK